MGLKNMEKNTSCLPLSTEQASECCSNPGQSEHAQGPLINNHGVNNVFTAVGSRNVLNNVHFFLVHISTYVQLLFNSIFKFSFHPFIYFLLNIFDEQVNYKWFHAEQQIHSILYNIFRYLKNNE